MLGMSTNAVYSLFLSRGVSGIRATSSDDRFQWSLFGTGMPDTVILPIRIWAQSLPFQSLMGLWLLERTDGPTDGPLTTFPLLPLFFFILVLSGSTTPELAHDNSVTGAHVEVFRVQSNHVVLKLVVTGACGVHKT